MFSLECQRLSGDPTEENKIIRSIDRLGSQNFIAKVEMSKTRGLSIKVRGGMFKGDVQDNVFVKREWWVPGKRCWGGDRNRYETKEAFRWHMDMQGMDGYEIHAGRED